MRLEQWSKGKRYGLFGTAAAAVVMIVTITALALSGRLPFFKGEPETQPEPPTEETTQGDLPVAPVKPEVGRGVWLEAGRDFATGENPTAEQARGQLDEALQACKDMGFDMVYLDAIRDGNAATYPDGGGQSDLLEYAVSKAREVGLYVCGVLPADSMLVVTPDSVIPQTAAAAGFCDSYQLDGAMLAGFDRLDWSACSLPDAEKRTALTEAVRELWHAATQAKTDLYFGASVPPVWANHATDERGSDTTAGEQALLSYHADTYQWIKDGVVDFLYIDARVSMRDSAAPYETVMKWWAATAEGTETDLYAGHAAGLVCTGQAGWNSPDELTKQMIALEELPVFCGSGFYSYADLAKNPQNSTELLKQYFAGKVDKSLILRELAVTQPKKTAFTTNESTVTFVGSSDPTFPVLLNGKELERTELGYFSIDVPLNVGENTIKLEHKGKTVVYTVTYRLEVLRSISPTDTVTAPGGTTITISAIALKGANVSASIHGSTVSMKPGAVENGEGDKIPESSDFQSYIGSYRLPDSTESEQNLGRISVRSTYQGQTDTLQGGTVIVSAKPKQVAPDPNGPVAELPDGGDNGEVPPLMTPYEPHEGVPGQADMCEIITDQAEGLELTPLDDRSSPLKTPLPAGTFDYVTGSANYGGTKYYYLASGRRVYQSDVKLFTGYNLPSNALRAYSTQYGGGTALTVMTAWKMPFNVSVGGQSYRSGYENRPYNIDSYTAQYVDIVFAHTAEASGLFDVSGSDLISRTEWLHDANANTTTLRLHLKKTGGFYGYKAYYNANGTLTFLLKSGKHPAGDSLSGYMIMLDAGHGSGAEAGGANTCLPNLNEGDINMQLTRRIKAALEARGAKVLMARPGDYDEYMADRVALCRKYNPDMYISVHCDSGVASAQGTTSYYYTPWSFDLAESIHRQLYSTYTNEIYRHDVTNRETRFYPFMVTRVFECPAVLIEYGFVSNREECNALVQEKNQELLAQATVRGITEYLKQR